MATKYFVNGGVNNLWSNTNNWSTSSGGAGGAGIPGTADVATFDGNSPNCTIDGATGYDIGGIDVQSTYTNTWTLNNTISSRGNITLGANMRPILGMGAIGAQSIGTKNLTTNGIVVPNFYVGSVSVVIALQDDLYISGVLIGVGGSFSGATRTVWVKGVCHVLGSSTFSSTAAVKTLNPVKMYGGSATASVNAAVSGGLVGYNQAHTN